MHYSDWSLSHSTAPCERKRIAMLRKSSEPKGYNGDVHSGFVYAAYLNSITARAPLSVTVVSIVETRGGGAGKGEDSDDVQRTYMGLCMWHQLFV